MPNKQTKQLTDKNFPQWIMKHFENKQSKVDDMDSPKTVTKSKGSTRGFQIIANNKPLLVTHSLVSCLHLKTGALQYSRIYVKCYVTVHKAYLFIYMWHVDGIKARRVITVNNTPLIKTGYQYVEILIV